MLPARICTEWRCAGSSLAICSSVNPVVPMTWTQRACAASAAFSSVASGAVKSITACALAKTSSGSPLTVTPRAEPPIASPRSRPIHSWPGRSVTPQSMVPGSSCTARISICPMRPAAPSTATRT